MQLKVRAGSTFEALLAGVTRVPRGTGANGAV